VAAEAVDVPGVPEGEEVSKVSFVAMYPSDFLADIGHLGNTELGIYWRLLLVYYRDGKPLPFDVDKLRRLAMAFTPEEFRCVDAVVSEFFALTNEADGSRVWRHHRADREIVKATSAHEKKSAAARATNEKRWKDAQRVAEQVAKRSLSDSLSDGEPEPEPEPEVIPSHASHVVETGPVSPDCPHAEILKLWAQHLPMARQPEDWTQTRQTLLRTRWREKPNRQNLEWWARFFAYVAESPFLTGRTHTRDRAPFLLSLDWLLKQSNFLKVIEGAYHTETA